ncbi:hypothetical protein TA3x_003013 [Tundrisphaera sp. TA3]|uniref:hypothetical protein n=1 Tax=Tundrisphaera sp. TA3 TaxID=3435775 RepID=UPI003EBD7A2E
MKMAFVAGLAVTAALTLIAPDVEAQVIRGGRTQTFVGAGGPVSLTPGVGYGYRGYASGYSTAPVYHYSYYAVPNPAYPARAYVGLDTPVDFPFHGQAYGHPYDPWTWPYLANNGRGLARYYDPPVK